MRWPDREGGDTSELINSNYMFDEYGLDGYEENSFPIAYLLTFGTYGTWLHGDLRGSHQRSRDNRLQSIKIQPNVPLNEKMAESKKQLSIRLDTVQRRIVEKAMTDVCEHRGYSLKALNVRTTHVHAVVSKAIKPEKIVNDLKAYSTRALRHNHLVSVDQKIWSRGASTRYLWKTGHLDTAVDYVLYCQDNFPLGTVFKID